MITLGPSCDGEHFDAETMATHIIVIDTFLWLVTICTYSSTRRNRLSGRPERGFDTTEQRYSSVAATDLPAPKSLHQGAVHSCMERAKDGCAQISQGNRVDDETNLVMMLVYSMTESISRH
jgi:hypothetical protein